MSYLDDRKQAQREQKNAQVLQARRMRHNAIALLALTVANPLDRLLTRRQFIVDEMRLQEQNDSISAAAQETFQQHRLWCFLVILIGVASLADVVLILPNLTGDLARRLAGGNDPGWLAILFASALFECLIVALLVAFKKLGDTDAWWKARLAARSREEYQASCLRLGGAWLARAAYIGIITAGFYLNFQAEQSKAQVTNELRVAAQEIAELSRRNGPAAQDEPSVTIDAPAFAAVSTKAGITVTVWALHIAILFLPAGRRRSQHARSLTYDELASELERIEQKVGTLGGKLAWRIGLARHDAECEDAVQAVLSEKVRKLMPPPMRPRVVDVEVTVVSEDDPRPNNRTNSR